MDEPWPQPTPQPVALKMQMDRLEADKVDRFSRNAPEFCRDDVVGLTAALNSMCSMKRQARLDEMRSQLLLERRFLEKQT